MKVGSLFSGIGGLDLGLERAGMTVAWQSEIDPYACRVLAKHWPNVPNLGDITSIDWSTVEPVDLVCGGYPCQPFSLAGTRAGENDARHLWPHFATALRVLRPRWALLENVPGHLSLGFGRVLGDLAELGFDAEWDCIPAAAVGAPHLRYRVFVVADSGGGRRSDNELCAGRDESRPCGSLAHPDGGRFEQRDTRERCLSIADSRRDVPNAGSPERRGRTVLGSGGNGEPCVDGTDESLADTNNVGLQGRDDVGSGEGLGASRHEPARSGAAVGWTEWTVEPDVGRVANGVPNRVDRLRCLGNAVVPQVAEYVGRRIMEAAA